MFLTEIGPTCYIICTQLCLICFLSSKKQHKHDINERDIGSYPPILRSRWDIKIQYFCLQCFLCFVIRNIFNNYRIIPCTDRIHRDKGLRSETKIQNTVIPPNHKFMFLKNSQDLRKKIHITNPKQLGLMVLSLLLYFSSES